MSQRFHQHFILPFIWNPFSFVEVTEDHVRWQHGLNERFNFPLESVRARHDPKGWFWGQVLGTGDVVIIEATEHRVTNILRGRALRKQISRQRELREEALKTGVAAKTTYPPAEVVIDSRTGSTSMTDPRDGNSYRVVKLRDGNWWLAENLRYVMLGSFPADEKPNETILATNPDYNWKRYGRLYTWEAAQKVSPPGWHLPGDREWGRMLDLYGGYGNGLGNDIGTDDIKMLIRDELGIEFGGFINTADHYENGRYYYGYFYGRMGGRFWSTTREVYYRFLQEGTAGRDCENVEKAFSVRCIKD